MSCAPCSRAAEWRQQALTGGGIWALSHGICDILKARINKSMAAWLVDACCSLSSCDTGRTTASATIIATYVATNQAMANAPTATL